MSRIIICQTGQLGDSRDGPQNNSSNFVGRALQSDIDLSLPKKNLKKKLKTILDDIATAI